MRRALATAAVLAALTIGALYAEPEDADEDEDFEDEWDCTHCCGDGLVEGDRIGWDDGQIVNCYACGGTGRRRDQRVF